MRDLVMADMLTPDALEAVRMSAEAKVAYALADINSWKVFNYNLGVKGESDCLQHGLLVNRREDSEIVVQNLLLTTHLGVGAIDRWATGATVTTVLLAWIAPVLLQSQAVSIYGVACLDTIPNIMRVDLNKGPARLMATWDIQGLYSSLTQEAFTDEAPVWTGGDIVGVNVMPLLTVGAPGSLLKLYGCFAHKKGLFLSE